MCIQIRRTQHTQCKYPDSRSNTVKGVFGVWFCVDTNFIPCCFNMCIITYLPPYILLLSAMLAELFTDDDVSKNQLFFDVAFWIRYAP